MQTRLGSIFLILLFLKVLESIAQSPRFVFDSLKVQLKISKTPEDQKERLTQRYDSIAGFNKQTNKELLPSGR